MLGKGSRQEILTARRRRRLAAYPDPPEAERSPQVRRRRRAPTPTLPRPSFKSLVGSPGRAVGLLLATLTFGVVAHFAFAQRYVVSNAVVLGAQRLSPDAVVDAAGIRGVRSFRLSAEEVAARVESHPEVRTAEVKIRLPSRVWISVEETRPLLTWATPSGALLIDENGLVVAGQAEGLVTVNDAAGTITGPGDSIPVEVVHAALALSPEFTSLEYRPVIGLVGTTSSGWEVWLGDDAHRAVQQTATLTALRARLSTSDVSLVDLRFDRPYYRTTH